MEVKIRRQPQQMVVIDLFSRILPEFSTVSLGHSPKSRNRRDFSVMYNYVSLTAGAAGDSSQ